MYEVKAPKPPAEPKQPTVEDPQIIPPEDLPPAPRELPEANKNQATLYNDETVAAENYYEEKEHECQQSSQAIENARLESAATRKGTQKGIDGQAHDDASCLRNPFKTDADGYYYSVKEEVDKLFKTYPKDKTLCEAFSQSAWVRVKGTAKDPLYLVGVLLNEDKVRYICYALAAEDRTAPPDEIKNVCAFVPTSVYDDTKGFFVIFQSAASGECVRPEIT
jgi:hypothetical protein